VVSDRAGLTDAGFRWVRGRAARASRRDPPCDAQRDVTGRAAIAGSPAQHDRPAIPRRGSGPVQFGGRRTVPGAVLSVVDRVSPQPEVRTRGSRHGARISRGAARAGQVAAVLADGARKLGEGATPQLPAG